MKNYFSHRQVKLKITVLFLGLTLGYGCSNDKSTDIPVDSFEEKIVVANRNNQSISFIDAISNNVIKTLAIPDSEPMYVVYVPKKDKIYVGDRAQKKIHVINPQSQEIEESISAGNGIFHMWADGQGNELWVTNDIDNTISVINLTSNTVTNTINIDTKPHDVFVTKDGTTAFVSVLTNDPASDKIYKYSTSTYLKTGEVNVGKEPHIYHLANNNLYIPCQSGELYTFDTTTLDLISKKNYAGAHGIFASPDQNIIFMSNIAGQQIYSINATTTDPANNPIASSNETPHNIVINANGNKMFVTHSGATANIISVYDVNKSGAISFSTTITAGSNPFGLTYFKRIQK